MLRNGGGEGWLHEALGGGWAPPLMVKSREQVNYKLCPCFTLKIRPVSEKAIDKSILKKLRIL